MSTAQRAKISTLHDVRTIDRRFFTAYAYLGIAAVFVGFARTYYFRSYAGLPPLSLAIHLHAVIYSVWMVLFAVQTSLVATKRVALHRRLGMASIGFAIAMVVVGLVAGVIGARDGWTGPQTPRDPVGGLSFLTVPIGDMVVFSLFFGGAVLYRRKPETHKRLMILAMCGAIMPAAFARLPLPFFLVLAFGFLLAGPLYDYFSRRRIHSVYKWGVPLILVTIPLRAMVGATETWHRFALWLIDVTGAR